MGRTSTGSMKMSRQGQPPKKLNTDSEPSAVSKSNTDLKKHMKG